MTGALPLAMRARSCFSLVARSSMVLTIALAFGACSNETGGGPVASTSSSVISETSVIARAMQWVDARLQYCQSGYDQPDGDPSCSSICRREENPAWDRYRSDCSGFVTWSWGLAPVGDGGYVTWDFAPYSHDFSYVVSGSSMVPGD